MSDLGNELANLLRLSAGQTLADEISRAMNAQMASTTQAAALAADSRSERSLERVAADLLAAAQKASAGNEPGAPAALMAYTAAKPPSSEPSSTTSAVVKAVLDGMGLGPVFRGLLSLFGGGEEEPAPVLPRYSAPTSVRLNAGVRRDSASPVGVDYGQAGESREIASPTPSVVVNVSAMDTQSFLDRSDDIARAVKRALLESHSLNDVIAEL